MVKISGGGLLPIIFARFSYDYLFQNQDGNAICWDNAEKRFDAECPNLTIYDGILLKMRVFELAYDDNISTLRYRKYLNHIDDCLE